MNSKQPITLTLLVLIVAGVIFGQWVAARPNETIAIIIGLAAALASLFMIARASDDRQFVVRLWLLALGIRILVTSAIYFIGLRDNIAPDWRTYDHFGHLLTRYWLGDPEAHPGWIVRDVAQYRSGWGMYYYVAAIYYIVGRNAFLLQLLSSIFTASASVLIYRIARYVHPDLRVARLSGKLFAIAPSLIIWGSLGVKEPLILFCLSLSLYLTIRLSNRLRIVEAVLLALSLFSLYALRHYVSFVVLVAIGGALLLSSKRLSPARILQGSLLALALGFMFVFYGAGDVAQRSLDLERIQIGREWSARVSESGYGGDVDITDSRQAIIYLPLGTAYFLLAPFPWMVRNTNHLIILPEMIVWWLSAPLLLLGFWRALRHRLRESLAILLFTSGLTFAYGLYLTNFGTAHRMRVQVLGFLIIFVSIGWYEWRGARIDKRSRARVRRPGFDRLAPATMQWSPKKTGTFYQPPTTGR